MPIDFTLTDEQKMMQATARRFAQKELLPVTTEADKLTDPWDSFLATKEIYKKAYELGFAMSFIPREYGGLGASNVDLQIVAEELCTVDPGFACTLLVNGLTLLPILWYGSEEQKDYWLRKATSDPTGTFLGGWIVSEPGGTANFDSPRTYPAGIQVTATHDRANGEYVISGRKMWNTNGCGWDRKGADVNVVIARIDRSVGGLEGLAAFIVPRETKGFHTTGILNTLGHRTTVQPELLFEDCRIPDTNVLPHSIGNGDQVITKAFTWSGPVAGIAAVGVMRCALDFVLKWSREYTGGGGNPIIHYQNVGYMLANMKMKIEAARYLSWKAAHYLDCHDWEGQEGGALSKIFCGELAVETVNEAMRVVGINSYLHDYPLQKCMRDVLCFPIYDAGNMGMQRRRLHGMMANSGYNPLAFAENLRTPFKKSMLGLDSEPGHPVAGDAEKVKPLRPIQTAASTRREQTMDEIQRLGAFTSFKAPLYIAWETTHKCNAECLHCYSNSGPRVSTENDLPTDAACSVIDQLADAGLMVLAFSGGEPMLRADWRILAERAKSRGLAVNIATNGFLVNSRIADELKDIGVHSVTVSLDSHRPELHDRFRQREGLFWKAVGAVTLLVERGIRVVVGFTPTKLNFRDGPEVIALAHKLGATAVNFSQYVPAGRGPISIALEANELRDTLLEWIQLREDYKGKLEIIWHDCRVATIVPEHDKRDYLGCGAGRLVARILPDGTVTPCFFLPTPIGSLRTQTFSKIWKESELLRQFRERVGHISGNCQDCEHLNICGGCRSVAYAYSHGNPLAGDPHCWIVPDSDSRLKALADGSGLPY
jgi:radical SAM protein with 4Fe4S-binding SPASM domain